MGIDFVKYHGLGNDFVLIDHRDRPDLGIEPEAVPAWCDRHRGIGADGVLFLGQRDGIYQMRLINADGSEAEMCGNGVRCLAKFMQELGIAPEGNQYRVQTGAGLRELFVEPDGQITVDMGPPRLQAAEIPTTLVAPAERAIAVPLPVADREWSVTAVSMGNPHAVVFVADVGALDLAAIGPQFETHPAFPQRVNTEFVQVLARDRLRMRVWERGAGATQACGTGACATVVAAVLTDRADRECTVELPGGDLRIRWDEHTVWMTGPAVRVFAGTR
ncbi:MAG: diaminopimelate epimerase [Oscillatoriales cyanobacterium SM2_1_8]|nr:diaminopimelate epimerase [Oscillatoriales cyanobacterium SM2_1_8]